MSFLRALRTYIGLGPDEEIEDGYLAELNARRRQLALDEIDGGEAVGVEPARRRASRRFEAEPTASVGRTGSGRDRPASSPGRRRAGLATDEVVRDLDRRAHDAEGVVASEGAEFAEQNEAETIDLTLIEGMEGVFDVGGAGLGGRHDIEPDVQLEPILAEDGTEAAKVRSGRHRRRGEADLAPVGPEPAPVRSGSSRRSGTRLREADNSGGQHSDSPGAVVRSIEAMRAKPRTLMPESFADAKVVADEFKRQVPVVLNLQTVDRDLARRLIDFASGICYALDGSMEKLASQVFLLIPASMEVSDEDRRRIEERGYAR